VIVEALHLVEHLAIPGEDAELEVAAPAALRAEPGAGPVRAAEIEELAIHDDDLHVDARTPP
jgi:hypothetical protein